MDTYENQPQEQRTERSVPQEHPWQPYQQPVYPYAQPEQPKKSGGKVWKAVLAGVLVLALVILSCSVTAAILTVQMQAQNAALSKSFTERLDALRQELEDKSYVGSGESISGTPNTTPDGSLTPAQVYAQHVDSVVAIACSTGSGSGFILSADGYVATNYHVVEGARSISITCFDGTEYPAVYVGGDQSSDIAVLKVEATGLQAAVIGRSDHLIVGDQVVAIGNPLGELASTLTVGYVSAKDRLVTTENTSQNMIQTDAAINNGNSGGPLFNMKGEVIGITSVKYSGMTSSGATIEGLGFAIPIDDVIGMMEDLMEHGYISGAYLGVSVVDVTPYESQAYGLPLGALVGSVEHGYCAETAGIRAQDVIVNLGGYSVESVSDLTRVLRKYEPGDTVSVTVFRISAGGEVTMTLTLDERPNLNQQASTPSQDTASTMPAGGSTDDWFDYFFGN